MHKTYASSDVFDIDAFFRQYLSQKLTTVPPNIRIAPPKTTESCLFCTSQEFLHSIVENLVRNSIEAMPHGGEIRLDWVYDEPSKSLLLEVADNGPGLEQGMRERLALGEAVASRKERGSGIGLLTVRSMVRSLGGSISVKSDSVHGTNWLITLPSMEEESEPMDLQELGIEEAPIVSEEKATLQ